MGEEKTKKDILEKIIDSEMLNDCPRSIPKPAKYKKNKKSERKIPNIEVGKRVVVRVGKMNKRNEVEGYLLCVIVDFTDNDGWWDDSTNLILYVINNTNKEKLDKFLGRLIHARYSCYSGYSFMSRFAINTFDTLGYNWLKNNVKMKGQ